MADRYWDQLEVPDALRDWVNENVVDAFRDFWESDELLVSAHPEGGDGQWVLTVHGPGKPTDEDPTGSQDSYRVQFDLLEVIGRINAPERAGPLRKLAEEIERLSVEAESLASGA